jgi:hypothetical protein
VNGFGRNDGSLAGLRKRKAADGRFTSHDRKVAMDGYPICGCWKEDKTGVDSLPGWQQKAKGYGTDKSNGFRASSSKGTPS